MIPPHQRLGVREPMLRGRLAVAALALALAGLCSASNARAVAASGLVVVPRPTSEPGLSYFKLTAHPGTVQRAGTIQLRNPGASTLRVVVSPVDGTTLSTLGSGYAPPGSAPHGSTRWLELGARTVTLPPRSAVAFPVTVHVPPTSKPGDYLSGISIEALGQRAQGLARKGVSIASVARYAIGVEVSLPGTRAPLIRFTGASIERQPAGLTFQLLAENRGNAILPGVHGGVLITAGGRTILSRDIAPGTFVTSSAIAYPVTAFTQAPAQGTRFHIKAYLRYPGGIATLDTNAVFGKLQAAVQRLYGVRPTPAPSAGSAWWKIAAVVSVLLYAVLTTILLLRRRKREPRHAGQP